MGSSEVVTKPKIYVFSAVEDGGDGTCYALAEDGTILGTHYCSNENFAYGDLGVKEGSRPDRHETYKAHYPDGYEMEFVKAKDFEGHEKLQAAIELCKKRECPVAETAETAGMSKIEITVTE